MEALPRITIITPTLNQAEFIERSIKSVLNQDYPNLQYIIIDGGSQDETVDIIKKYADKITYWVSENDQGQSHAINKGLLMADGDLINWLNSDDELLPGVLNQLASLYNSQKEKNLFIGTTEFYRDGMNYGKNGRVVFETAEITLAMGQVNQPAMYYRRDAFEKMGILNQSLHYCMDVDWWMKYILHYGIDKIYQTNQVWIKFNFHNNSKTVLYQEKFERERIMLYETLFSNENQLENSGSINILNVQHHYNLWIADKESLRNNRKKALRFFLKVNPFRIGIWGLRRYFGVLKNIILYNNK